MKKFLFVASVSLLLFSCRPGDGQAGMTDEDSLALRAAFDKASPECVDSVDIPDVRKLTSVLELTLPEEFDTGVGAVDSTVVAELSTVICSHKALSLPESRFNLLDDLWIPDEVVAFTRKYRRDVVLVLANFSPRYTSCALPDGVQWSDAFTGEIWEGEIVCPVLDPWGYKILLRR